MNLETERLVEFGALIMGFLALGGIVSFAIAIRTMRKTLSELRSKVEALEIAKNEIQRDRLAPEKKAFAATNAK